jgi:hypothetical protein
LRDARLRLAIVAFDFAGADCATGELAEIGGTPSRFICRRGMTASASAAAAGVLQRDASRYGVSEDHVE